jgi:hypothetical protein
MGWGRMFLLGNIGQQLDIEDVKDYLNKAITEINKTQELDLEQGAEIERLKKENQELKLYTLGLVRLLSSKGIISDSELSGMVAAIDNRNSGNSNH